MGVKREKKCEKNPPKKTSHRRDGAKCSSYTNIIYVMFKSYVENIEKKSLVLFPVLPSLPELFFWLALCSDILNDFVVTYISPEKREHSTNLLSLFFTVSHRLFPDSRRINQTQGEHDMSCDDCETIQKRH